MLLTKLGIGQNWSITKQYVNPIIDMKPKIDKLDDKFKETLAKYQPNSLTPIEEVKCEKGDTKGIRCY